MFTKAQRIFERIADRLKVPNWRTTYARRPEDFSRQRKVGLVEIIRIVLNRVDRTSDVEVQRFCGSCTATGTRPLNENGCVWG